MKGFTFIPPAGAGAARLRVVDPAGRSTDFFTTPGDSGVHIEAGAGSYTAFVEPLGQRPSVFHFDVGDDEGMEIIDADQLAAAPEVEAWPESEPAPIPPAPSTEPSPSVPSAFAVMSKASLDPLFFLGEGEGERPPPEAAFQELEPAPPPPVTPKEGVRVTIGLSNDSKPFDPGGWVPYDGPLPRIEQDDRGLALVFDGGLAMGSPSHSRVRLAISVEGRWVQRLLAPLFNDGLRIGLSVAPGEGDFDLSVTPLDPQRLALAQALDAGVTTEGQAIFNAFVSRNPIDRYIHDDMASDPWTAALAALVAIRFRAAPPSQCAAWAHELAERYSWITDALILKAHSLLETSGPTPGPEARSAALSAVIRARRVGAPYFGYTNVLASDILARLVGQIPREGTGPIPTDRSTPSRDPLSDAARIERGRWQDYIKHHGAAGAFFTWRMRIGGRARGLLDESNTRPLWTGEVLEGRLTEQALV